MPLRSRRRPRVRRTRGAHGIVGYACRSEHVMKSLVLAFALTLPAAGLLTAAAGSVQSGQGSGSGAQEAPQERPRIPDDSVELNVSGCLKGRVLSVSDSRETDTQSGPIVRGKSFRLAGKGDIMKEVKEEDGSFVEVTGVVKRSALDSKGIKIGKRVAVGGGSPVAGTHSMPEPAADVAVMDITSLRHRSSSCAVK
jgi:hypothetical protein